MPENNISLYFRTLVIAIEVFLISFAGYKFSHDLPFENAQYLSLDVLFCFPIIQTARLAAVHSGRRYDTQTATFTGISLALLWSGAEYSIAWPEFPIFAFALNTFTRSVVFTMIGRVLIKLWREKDYARKDILTGLANRLELLERMDVEQRRSKRSGKPYSLLFIDIDNFKQMNDIHGHQGGDDALVLLADILRKSCRGVDIASRLGGDEFVLLLPETDKPSCDFMIKRINSSASLAFDEKKWPISLSIGHTTHTGTTPDPTEAIAIADRHMYVSKKNKQ